MSEPVLHWFLPCSLGFYLLPENRELLSTTVHVLSNCAGVGSADIVPNPGPCSLIFTWSTSDIWEYGLVALSNLTSAFLCCFGEGSELDGHFLDLDI